MKNEYFVVGDVAHIIAIRKGDRHIIRVDADDMPMLHSLGVSWNVTAHPKSNGLVASASFNIGGKKTRRYIHRVIMNPPAGMQVDHINHDTLDNRRTNLRILSDSENKQNRYLLPSHNKSGVRGVQWSKQKNKWQVSMVINKRRIHAGFYSDIAEAEKVAIETRAKYAQYSQEAMRNPQMLTSMSELEKPRLRSDNTSGVRGVSWSKKYQKWRARVHMNGKEKQIGLFSTIEEAEVAIKSATKPNTH